MASAQQLKEFEERGYLVLEDFLDGGQCAALREECRQLVEDMDPREHHTTFSTTKQSYRDNYFMNSGDKIAFFFEEGALNDNGELVVDKQRSLNKIGHALHEHCPGFKNVTFSDKIKDLLRSLKFTGATVPQSMYIFKQPGIGGEVVPHQDATFLWTDPVSKVIGVWIALEDATLENGCLWFIPGSHKQGLVNNYRMVRNTAAEGPSCVFRGDKPAYDDGKFIPVPVKKGSLVLIDGLVVHKSERNTSDKSRHIYTFHLYDRAEVQWSAENWLQPTQKLPFVEVFPTESL